MKYLDLIKSASLENYFKKIDFDIENAISSKIRSGSNSDIYKIFYNDKKLVFKIYPKDDYLKRNRLKSELNFLNLLISGGYKNIPRPLIWDEKENWILMSYLEGDFIKKVKSNHYEKLFKFIIEIQKLNRNDNSNINLIQNASEAKFNVIDHLQSVQSRIDIFKEKIYLYQNISNEYKVSISKLLDKLNLRLDYIKVCQYFEIYENSDNKIIKNNQRILSQSDIGFHNTFVDKNENLLFFDFEYAGWDDPLKMISDIILQPDNRIGSNYFYLLKAIISNFVVDADDQNKLFLTCMIYRLKWTCIILNPIFKKEYKYKFNNFNFQNLIIKANNYFLKTETQEKDFIFFLKENFF